MSADYFVDYTDADGWRMGIDGQVLADGYRSEAEAWADADQHYDEQQPESCDRCGDQAVCPDCVGA